MGAGLYRQAMFKRMVPEGFAELVNNRQGLVIGLGRHDLAFCVDD